MNQIRQKLETDEDIMRNADYWKSSTEENVFFIESNGLLFELDCLDYQKKSSEEKLLLCKPMRMVKEYIKLFSHYPHGRILELGIFEGGSAVFFATLLKNIEKIVSVDRSPHNKVVASVIQRSGLEDKIKLYYNTPQDSPDLRSIIKNELGGRPDIIIDDCSHLYGPTKKRFS